MSEAGGAISLVALCHKDDAAGPWGGDAVDANRELKRSLDSYNNMLHIMNGAFGAATRGPGVDRTVKAVRAAFVRSSAAVLGHGPARAAATQHDATAVSRLEELLAELTHIESVNPNKAVYSNRALLLLSRADPDGLGSKDSMSAIAAGAMVAKVYGRKLSTTENVQRLEQEVLRLKASNEALSVANERLEAASADKERENAALREQLARHGLEATATATATTSSIEDVLSMPLGLSTEFSVALGGDAPLQSQ